MNLTFNQINDLRANQLTEREMVFLKLRVNLTLEEIATVSDMSKQNVGRILESAYAKIEAQQAYTVQLPHSGAYILKNDTDGGLDVQVTSLPE